MLLDHWHLGERSLPLGILQMNHIVCLKHNRGFPLLLRSKVKVLTMAYEALAGLASTSPLLYILLTFYTRYSGLLSSLCSQTTEHLHMLFFLSEMLPLTPIAVPSFFTSLISISPSGFSSSLPSLSLINPPVICSLCYNIPLLGSTYKCTLIFVVV